MNYIKPFNTIGMNDLAEVGGKNASLGEMIQNLAPQGVSIPDGFAITAGGYRLHLEHNKLNAQIKALLQNLDTKNLEQLAQVGQAIRSLIQKAQLAPELIAEITSAYQALGNSDVAVRSSATAEDLPDASFAGQQETYLNIKGIDALLLACRNCFASLFTNRAISYRVNHGFDHLEVALSIGVQKMVRSDLACSGIMFTLDTESGFPDVIFITAGYGLGEPIVQGSINPDEYYVHKPTLKLGFKPILKKRLGSKTQKLVYTHNAIPEPASRHNMLDAEQKLPNNALSTKLIDVSEQERQHFTLTDIELLSLAQQAMAIEEYYSSRAGTWTPMDIEWAKDGNDGKLYIVQARPETIHGRSDQMHVLEEYVLDRAQATKARVLATGKSVGHKIATGTARVVTSINQMGTIKPGEILVTEMTDPDWEPIMKVAAGIVTNRGGRTCHAAIISREIGIPAIVGTGTSTTTIKTGDLVTIDCSSGEVGLIYAGQISFEIKKINLASIPTPPTDIYVNLGNPDEAFAVAKLPATGVGLARLEFIINTGIQIHPMALVYPERVTDGTERAIIESLTLDYTDKKQFFVDKLAQEAGTIAAAFYPRPVIMRMSDFKSNEYRKLIAGSYFEPEEENPMIGFRGASRYHHPAYQEAFALECQAMHKMRDEMGLTNVILMIPFVRTVPEAKAVIATMAKHGLVQGHNNLQIYMMCEIPSNVILIDDFSKIFDGFSIGSNDLTQMTLAVDRDSHLVADIFDERNPAVMAMLRMAITGAKRNGKKIGICGQGPSDYPELASFLVACGIDSMSLNPDAVLKEIMALCPA